MDFAAHKAATLVHCLEMAKVDPAYAEWAAGEYERREPWLLENLQRKVRQEISRAQKEAIDASR